MATSPQTYGTKIQGGWFDESPDPITGRERHLYRDEAGVIVPSVTQVLAMQGFVDFSKVKFEVLDRKRQIGSAVHRAAEFLDSPQHGELDWSTVAEVCTGYVLAYEVAVQELDLKAEKVEYAAIVTVGGMKFGVRLDRAGKMGNGGIIPAVWELKTSATKWLLAWRLQTAAQELALEKPEKGTYTRLSVQLFPNGTYKAEPYSDKNDVKHFLCQLSAVHLKLNNGYKLPGLPDEIPEDGENGE